MTFSFPGTFPLAIVLTCATCCLGCRENASAPSKPAEQQADSSTPKDTPLADSSPETSPKQSADSKDGAVNTGAEPAADQRDAEQASSLGSNGSSGAGIQSIGSGRRAPGLGKPNAPASAANKPNSSSNRASRPTFSSPRFESAEAALAYAKRQREKSSNLSGSGDTATAYEEALQGWQGTSHLADKGCGSLSGELLADLEKYGEQLGSKRISIIGKPLKIK